jgi:transketolase N-terminal domain/subunit
MGVNSTEKLLKYSYDNNLSHIPSALSMNEYLSVIFKTGVVKKNDYIAIGKPFGAQAYYLIWRELGWVSNIEELGAGVKHDEIDFVDYSEETIGNALGVASGIAMTTDARVWVNISDATLQMGNTLEAIQLIGQWQQKNIFVTIDNNNAQVLGRTEDILNVEPVFELFKGYGWDVNFVDGHNEIELKKCFDKLKFTKPTVVVCNTIKGGLVKEMSSDIKKWHYKKIECESELKSLCEGLGNNE